ncbi:hypothetical protein AB0I00_06580 [Streptomyces sp. NPDC050803]|uniref:hypothetical protein n=1 Tax=unclassified Streptomyces TaxID=2593676 RepID=UPI003416C2E2
MTTDQPGEQPSLSDEQLESFLREVTEGGSVSAPKEPSARARMVTQRLREQDEAAERDRKRGWGRKPAPAEPPGWRTGPSSLDMKRRRRLWPALAVLACVAVAVIAVRPSLVLGDDSSSEPAAPSTSADAELPTLDEPFRGSPAQTWAEGADAIELPPAKAAGGMSKDEVALALRRTKEFLVGTNLDPEVLRGGQPTEAMALLDPEQPDLLSGLRSSLRSPTEENDPIGLVSRFDPDEVRPAGDVVKVRGSMAFEAGKGGQVRVHADYTFVYPLVRASGEDDRVARTIVRRDLTTTLADPAKWISTEGKLAIERYAVDTFNNECEVYDGYLHPVFPGNDPTRSPTTGAARDPYDRSESLAEQKPEECGRLTRS